jgi:uncharacterized membrane protein YphA (DoxX/SURF4 family)
MKYLVQISRILVGLLFIISGLIKSNDTVGFAYKLEEYYTVFGVDFLVSTAVLQAMIICIVEVMLGVMLLLGNRVKLTVYLLLAMILFFTFLTFYSAYFNKVTDCGCFGDALKLTPWQSFTKDIVLLVLILLLVIGKKYIKTLVGKKPTAVLLAIALILNIAFPVYTYNYLPVKDFRPYAVGKDIKKGMEIPPNAPKGKFESKLFYKNLKSGQIKEFTSQNYPWQDTLNWAWERTETIELEKAFVPPIHDFSLTNVEGSEYTDDILNYPGYQFFLVSRDLLDANKKVQSRINDFAALCEKDSVPFYGLTSNTPQVIDEFRHEVQAMYDFYIVDGTQLKTMIRSNPGLILLKGSTVLAMWHYNSFPSYDAVKKELMK